MVTEKDLKAARKVLAAPARYQEHHGLVAWARRIITEHEAAERAVAPQATLFETEDE